MSPVLRSLCLLPLCLILPALGGCLGAPAFPAADLDADGWTLHTGQALWQPAADGAPELAGELLVAKHAAGERLISFVKPPLPLFTARTWDRYWRIQFVEKDRHYAGRGKPPSRRFVWFALPGIIAGEPPPKGWTLERRSPLRFTLRHEHTGEFLRVALDP